MVTSFLPRNSTVRNPCASCVQPLCATPVRQVLDKVLSSIAISARRLQLGQAAHGESPPLVEESLLVEA